MGEQTRDRAEVQLLLDVYGRPTCLFGSDEHRDMDRLELQSQHVTAYVPKSELEAARAELELARAEVQGLYEAFRGSGHSPKNPREAAQAIGQLRDAEVEGELARAVCDALCARHSHYVSCLEVLTDEPLMAALAAYKAHQGASK